MCYSFKLSLVLFIIFSLQITAQEPSEKTIDIKEIQVPVFEGCEGIQDNKIRKDCLIKRISNLISQNLDRKLLDSDGEIGINKIYVQFKIDEQGAFVNINARAITNALEEEAIRVVKALPNTIKPAYQNGKPVSILHAIPIKYVIKETAREKRKRLRTERKNY